MIKAKTSTMQHKSKKILSELSTFLRNNDNSDAIFSVSLVMEGLRFSAKDLGYEKRHNCKLTALQTLQLLILSRSAPSATPRAIQAARWASCCLQQNCWMVSPLCCHSS